MRKPDKCVHYNGTVNECCGAGVNYRELAGPGDAWGKRLPCVGRFATAAVVAVCDRLRLPTVEEVEADERAMEGRLERMGKVRAAIVAACGGPWKKGKPGVSGRVKCPCCDGAVSFTRSGYNGHVHARCSTEGCAAWVE